jgi:ribonucleoside-diphosphate reductase beta chain
VAGLSLKDLRKYLEYLADRRLESLGITPVFGSRNPFAFMELQDVQELANFFERRVSAYQVGVSGDVVFEEEF